MRSHESRRLRSSCQSIECGQCECKGPSDNDDDDDEVASNMSFNSDDSSTWSAEQFKQYIWGNDNWRQTTTTRHTWRQNSDISCAVSSSGLGDDHRILFICSGCDHGTTGSTQPRTNGYPNPLSSHPDLLLSSRPGPAEEQMSPPCRVTMFAPVRALPRAPLASPTCRGVRWRITADFSNHT